MKENIKSTLARSLAGCGVSADILTFAGLAFAFLAAWLIVQDRLPAAGAALLCSGLCDLLDGEVARVSGKAGVFGGILDSSLDRYGDGAVLGGILIYCAGFEGVVYALLALSALIGSFSVSYVRARAECEMDDCRTGFWERGERLVLLSLALLFNNPNAALWILGTVTHWTVLQRLLLSKMRAKEPTASIPFYLRSSPRSSAAYLFKAAAVVLLVIFWRP